MTQNKTMTSLMIGMGVLATAALATQKTDETQAATTRKVAYTEGATTVWTSPTVGQSVKRYVLPNQSIEFVASKKVYSQTWLQTTDGGWVAEKYLAIGGVNTAADANTATATAPATSTTTATAPTATNQAAVGTLTATYQDGATTVWNSIGFTSVKGYLATGQTAEYVATKQVSGVTWYQLQNGGWVCGSFVANGKQTVSKTPAPATPAPAATEKPATSTETATTTAPATSTPAATTPAAPAAPAVTAPAATTPAPAPTAPAASTNNNQNTTTNTNNTNTASTNQNQTVNKPVVTAPTAPSTSTSTAKASRAQIVAYAKTFQGVPYVWGGTTPSGFDCSGLVQYVYAHFGINLPRVTYSQEYAGTMKSVASAQAGDLLFFGNRGSTYHVAISLGGGQYLHAPVPGDVVKIGSNAWWPASFAMSVPGVY